MRLSLSPIKSCWSVMLPPLVLAGLAATAAPEFHNGVCWGHGKTAFYNGLDEYSGAAANASLAALAATGASHVQIETAW